MGPNSRTQRSQFSGFLDPPFSFPPLSPPLFLFSSPLPLPPLSHPLPKNHSIFWSQLSPTKPLRSKSPTPNSTEVLSPLGTEKPSFSKSNSTTNQGNCKSQALNPPLLLPPLPQQHPLFLLLLLALLALHQAPKWGLGGGWPRILCLPDFKEK